MHLAVVETPWENLLCFLFIQSSLSELLQRLFNAELSKKIQFQELATTLTLCRGEL